MSNPRENGQQRMSVYIRKDDAVAAKNVPQALRGEKVPALLRELNDAIDKSSDGGFVEVSADVAMMAHLRLLTYSHSQGSAGRWSRFKEASDRIWYAMREADAG